MIRSKPSKTTAATCLPATLRLGLRALLGMSALAGTAQAATFTGTVFEDAQYGGGAGRTLAASGGAGLAGVRVELYRVSDGAFIAAATTAVGGTYSLSSGATAVAMRVRVVNGTVRSSRTGGACTTCVPVQTFATNASSGAAVAVADRVGGEVPGLSDAASNTASANYSTLNTATTAAQSIAIADPALTTSTITGINFGFNFDTVVNVRDAANCTPSGTGNTFYPCQGSLRQFIINSNALGGEGTLAQAGTGQLDGFTAGLPAGFESSIFMIPNGSANPGQNTTYANQLTGGVAVITLATALTTVSASSTRLDATTQTVNVGNTNSGTLGTGGTVGVDALQLLTFQRPEVQIAAGNQPVILSGSNDAILGFALRQGGIRVTGTSGVVRNNLAGMTATGDSSGNTSLIGIEFTGTNCTIRGNFVTVNNSGIRTDNGGAGSLIQSNEVARPTSGQTNTFDGILLVGTVSATQVIGNLTRDQRGGGIEVGFGGGAPASSITVDNNTVRNNGFDGVGGGAPSTERSGIVAYAYSGNNVVFSRNLVHDNAGPGVMVSSGSNNTRITQNRFFSNGGLSIDLNPSTADPNTMGVPDGVTLNDSGDGDTGPNGLGNYPVVVSATRVGANLLLSGFARPGSAIELYVAQVDFAGFGEGFTYLTTLTEGSAADLAAGTGIYGPGAINGIAQGTDNTNRFSFSIVAPGGVVVGTVLTGTATSAGETSEFGGNVVVTAGPALQAMKSVQPFSDPFNGATNPKSIPGSIQSYTVRYTNQGAGPVDNNSIVVTDPIATNTKLFVGDLGVPGSGPVVFVNGAPSSGLTWTFTALNSTTDDLEFSNDGGVTWTYSPTPDADGCDAAVTHVRMRPKGIMSGNGGGDPYFELRFRVQLS